MSNRHHDRSAAPGAGDPVAAGLATAANQATIITLLAAQGLHTHVAACTALAASFVAKASPGTLYGAVLKLDATAPTATYYLQLINITARPANGAVALLPSGCQAIAHVNGIDDEIDFSAIIGTGIVASIGVVIALSTTAATLTISGAYLWLRSAQVGP